MSVITEEQLIAAAVDVQTLQEIVNSAPGVNVTGIITTRLGEQVKCLARIIQELQTVAPAITYATEVELLASAPSSPAIAYALDSKRFFKYLSSTWSAEANVGDVLESSQILANTLNNQSKNYGETTFPGILSKATGNVTASSAGSVYTDYLRVYQNTVLQGISVGVATFSTGSGVVFYDKNRQYLGYTNWKTDVTSEINVSVEYPTAYYIRVYESDNPTALDFRMKNGTNSLTVELEQLVSDLVTGLTNNKRADFQAGFLSKTSGTVSGFGTSGSWSFLDYVPVFEDTILNKNHSGSSGTSNSGAGLVLYDKDKQYLQYYNFLYVPQQGLRIGDINPSARFIRIGVLQTEVGIVDFNTYVPLDQGAIAGLSSALQAMQASIDSAGVALQGNIDVIASQQRQFLGEVVDYFSSVESGFYDQANGAPQASSAYVRSTLFTPVLTSSVLVRNGYVGVTSSVGFLTFYDESENYVGFYNPANLEEVTISERETALSLTAGTIKFVKMSSTLESHTLAINNLIQPEAVAGLSTNVNLLNALSDEFNVDFFTENQNFVVGWISSGTGILQTSGNWYTTAFVVVKSQDSFEYTLQAGVGTEVASISLWDANQNFLGFDVVGLSSFGVGSGTYIVPADVGGTAVAFIRASTPQSLATRRLFGFKRQTDVNDFQLKPTALIPDEIYAIVNEELDLYLRGLMPDRSFDLTSNIPEVFDIAGAYTPSSTASLTAEFRARGDDGSLAQLGSSVIQVASVPISPTGDERNIIILGDSLIEGIIGATGVASDGTGSTAGASTNEFARVLTGTGTSILNNAFSRTSYGLSNIRILGTRGDLVQAHEGRSGWSIANYKDQISVSGVTNAFNNTGANGFDLDHYLTQVTHTVNATGSNLTVIIALGWNDSLATTSSAASIQLGELIDLMKATHPDVDVIVQGITATPALVQKTHTGTRFVSERETFIVQIKEFGEAFKEVCATKTNSEFLQVSHVCNPEVMYPRINVSYSQRSSLVLENIETDYVHPDRVGYAIIADAWINKFIHKYCQ